MKTTQLENTNVRITVRDGYKTGDVSRLIREFGANVTNESDNTVEATVSRLLLVHLKNSAAVSEVTDLTAQAAATPEAPAPAPAQRTWGIKLP